MSIYQNTLNAFMHLLNTQPDLFTEEHRSKTIELLAKQPDEPQALSNSICGWLKKVPEADTALSAIKDKNKEMKTKAPGSKKANTDIPQYQTDKQSIINAIQQSSSAAKDDDKNIVSKDK